jgi:hypothetical protein
MGEAGADWCSGQSWLGQRLERRDRTAEGLQELKNEAGAAQRTADQARQAAEEDLQDLAVRMEEAASKLEPETVALCRQARDNGFKEAGFREVALTGEAEIRAQLRLNLSAIGRYRAAAGLLKAQARDLLALAENLDQHRVELDVLTRHLTRLQEIEPEEPDQDLEMTIQAACRLIKRSRELRNGFEPLSREELLSQALGEAGSEKVEEEPDLEAFLKDCTLREKPKEEEKPKKPWYQFW